MKNIALLVLAMFIISCNKNNKKADAYGNFETTEITVSSESNGKIEFLNLEEGDVVEKGKTVGLIDTLQLYYTKMQLIASQKTVSSKSGNVLSQKQVLQEQLKTAKIEQTRIKNMFSENAATKRQVDEINGKVKVIEEQIKGVGTQNAPIKNEANSFSVQIEKINDQIKKCNLVNPIKGTVLTKYAEPNEVTSSIKIGQQVKVKIDDFEQTKEYIGNIIWISSQAEFTPKIIQTKEERANLVYAVKIRVKNDGSLKIGMPAEIWIK